MRFYDAHVTSLLRWGEDSALAIGIAGGRVPAFPPDARWLYSVRVMLLVVKVEILWTTGKGR